MMLKLGAYSFSIDSAAYERLTRVNTYRWQAQERLNRAPAYQYLGVGTTYLELTGTLYAQKPEDLQQLNLMRQQANQGKPLQLVDGVGHVYGGWCIQAIREENTVFTQEGAPLKTTFNLALVKYGEDGAKL